MDNKQEETDIASPHSFSKKRIIYRLLILPIVAILGLYLLSMTSSKPGNLGVNAGQLAPCPDSPNCVSTQTNDSEKQMAPIRLEEPNQTLDRIKEVVSSNFPRAKLVSEDTKYLHFEFTSLIFRFVDDVEFYLDESESMIHFRSASRVGHSDLGANRKRMNKILELLK